MGIGRYRHKCIGCDNDKGQNDNNKGAHASLVENDILSSRPPMVMDIPKEIQLP